LYDEVMQGEVNTKDQIFMVMHETHNSEKMPSLVAMISIVAEYFNIFLLGQNRSVRGLLHAC
jgi:hypothetical protein